MLQESKNHLVRTDSYYKLQQLEFDKIIKSSTVQNSLLNEETILISLLDGDE